MRTRSIVYVLTGLAYIFMALSRTDDPVVFDDDLD
jgi:hypothetical protein